MSFILWLLLCLVLNTVISTLVSYLIPNYYMASLISSIIIAFVYAILVQRDKRHFYRYRNFWIYFLATAIIFMLFDALFWII